ncbi:hypothetical protein IMCC3317_43420 [Kordia antarctica]|uniref:FAD-dependent urate hydroxylase HpyO/Asp monooxygenase CreE-like FAD/NAD(P)-binding domain-containing protein n=1 Tax=Kordia antarctica TaxID=1218801 RepID=A0A7L4ZQR7_9FLAO|nr:FAD/NAD(P)-binding protein [Kordia antarctica]QHI38942.1 hypothetical protein IMCC3317_43420 [Kordia antarctica]
MKKSTIANIRKIGIIGIGPRGGYAFEKFIVALTNKTNLSQIHFLLFEETGNFGNGSVYNTNQIESNWVNITERILLLEKRIAIDLPEIQIPSFPSYHEWTGKDFEKISKNYIDTYPPRAEIGTYLQERFQSFITPLLENKVVTLYSEQVTEVIVEAHHKISIKTNIKTYKEIDEILLTIGHQPTELSEQISKWKEFAANQENIHLFTSPYPIENFLKPQNLLSDSVVGIRGFGLAMIDITRAIATTHGNFIIKDADTKACEYIADADFNGKLIPFSLDGLPPVPKPLNALIDEQFTPTAKQRSAFEANIGNSKTQKEATSPQFLMQAFAPIAATIYVALEKHFCQRENSAEAIEKIILKWLEDPKYTHKTIVPTEQSVEKTMQYFIDMATGNKAISLDYCIGQVWRHCQPSIYEQLSFNKCSEEVFADIIALDESTKRYSYGPPVESIQQLLALVKANVLNLEMLTKPEIELTEKGWCFHADGKSETANIMINSVLDSPEIKSVNSPVIKKMLANNLIEAVHDDLGIITDENGYVVSKNKDTKTPIALLGRLAKGTIIGVDAILECYGSRPVKWAKEAVNRHINYLSTEK